MIPISQKNWSEKMQQIMWESEQGNREDAGVLNVLVPIVPKGSSTWPFLWFSSVSLQIILYC